MALGVPLINAQYYGNADKIGLVSIALVLYQGEQILVAQLLVPVLKKWVETEIQQKKDLEAAQAAAGGAAGDAVDVDSKHDGIALTDVDAQVASEESVEGTSSSQYSSEVESGILNGTAGNEKKHF